MSSLRRRLLLSVLLGVGMVWLATAVWFHFEVRQEAREFLDVRLVESARMVRGLLSRGELLDLELASVDTPADLPPPSEGGDEGALACQILASEGRLLALSSGAPETPLADIESGFGDRRLGETEWRVYALPVPERGLRIVVGERHDVRQELVGEIAMGMLAPLLVLMPLLGALVWFGITRGLHPLEALGESIARRDPDNLSPIPSGRIPAEARPLVRSINALLSRLDAAFERERRFTADAAHELRTPLAALKAHVQVARAANNAATRERALGHLESAVDRTSRLVETMLALARLEGNGAGPPTEAPAALVHEVIEELADLAMRRDHELDVALSAALPPSSVPASAFRMAVRNLIENALSHTQPGGQVRLALYAEGAQMVFETQDSGPGIPVEELDEVRKPFRRGAQARGPGSGLGLAIVGRIAELYGGALELENQDPAGLRARLRLPLQHPAGSA